MISMNRQSPKSLVGLSLVIVGILSSISSPLQALAHETPAAAPFFSADQLHAFDRDGFLVLSDVLDSQALQNVINKAAAKLVTNSRKTQVPNFSVVERGILLDDTDVGVLPHCNSDEDEDDGDSNNGEQTCAVAATVDLATTSNAFREIAVNSVLGQACAELLRLDADTDNLRILRDVFLAKPVHAESECDWHVDDAGFWPEQFCNDDNEPIETGINVWIALEDMPYLGSMALAAGSHRAVWRHDAYQAIGQDRTTNSEFTRDDLVRIFSGGVQNKTCGMGESDPELRARVEETAAVFDLRAGDVIFASRLLFHKTLAVTDEGKAFYDETGQTSLSRYSIRYVPGTARLVKGYSLEWSTLQDSENAGRTLNEVAAKTSHAWYPQVWPAIESNLDTKLAELASGPLREAKAEALAEQMKLFQSVKEAKKRDQNEVEDTTTPGDLAVESSVDAINAKPAEGTETASQKAETSATDEVTFETTESTWTTVMSYIYRYL